MERLYCPTCGNEVFFDSLRCVRSDTQLAFELRPGGSLSIGDASVTGACLMREWWRCNWRPTPSAVGESPGRLCPNCVIVDTGIHGDNPLLIPFLSAQRRGLAQLAQLGVGWSATADAPGLRFSYRSRSAGEEVSMGHLSGAITLDLDEADPAHGEEVRFTLGEQYRTPLGHIRHELGHYVWLRHVAPDPQRLTDFREVFGDERVDYRSALDAHYGRVDDGTWRDEFVSHYASAHPWEDFAESWAQVMHIHDVVSTGAAWGIIDAPSEAFDPKVWLSSAVTTSLAANELARSMGARDLYPFALSAGARRKIETAWKLVQPA